jgi:lipid A 4'-phosphatase
MLRIPFSLKSHLLLNIIILAIGTLVFRFTDLDLVISDFWYQYDKNLDWVSSSKTFWGWIYIYGTGPAILVLLAAFITIIYSLFFYHNKLTRIKAICIILVILIGPGAIINGVLKPNLGRPRPYDIERYDGSDQFLKILQFGEVGDSFPSGHASAGFVLTILFYVFYCHRKKLAWLSLAGSIMLGLILSLTRIAQGGHFASDVFWSFSITQIVNCTLYFKLVFPLENIKQEAISQVQGGFLKKQMLFYVSTLILVAIFFFAFLLNSSITRHTRLNKKFSPQTQLLKINCVLPEEKIVLLYGGSNLINFDFLVLANGFSWSEFDLVVEKETRDNNQIVVTIQIDKSGMTRDYNGRLKIILPRDIALDLENVKGKLIENNLN